MSPPCFPLGSKLVHRPELDFHISLQHVAPVRGPRERQGQEPGWHPRKVWLCVCVVCVHLEAGTHVSPEARAHT